MTFTVQSESSELGLKKETQLGIQGGFFEADISEAYLKAAKANQVYSVISYKPDFTTEGTQLMWGWAQAGCLFAKTGAAATFGTIGTLLGGPAVGVPAAMVAGEVMGTVCNGAINSGTDTSTSTNGSDYYDVSQDYGDGSNGGDYQNEDEDTVLTYEQDETDEDEQEQNPNDNDDGGSDGSDDDDDGSDADGTDGVEGRPNPEDRPNPFENNAQGGNNRPNPFESKSNPWDDDYRPNPEDDWGVNGPNAKSLKGMKEWQIHDAIMDFQATSIIGGLQEMGHEDAIIAGARQNKNGDFQFIFDLDGKSKASPSKGSEAELVHIVTGFMDENHLEISEFLIETMAADALGL